MNGATSTDSTIATLAVGTIRLDDCGAVRKATVFNIKLHSKTQVSGMGMFGGISSYRTSKRKHSQ